MVKLTSEKTYTQLVKAKGLSTFDESLVLLRNMPYGRNSNREDFTLPIIENRGSCSSKHAFVYHLAKENDIPIELYCVMYKMNAENTPNASSVFNKYHLEYLPEAHCVLKYNDEFIDLTFVTSAFSEIESEVLNYKLIDPEWLIEDKITYHQAYLRQWLAYSGYENKFDEIWKIREEIIAFLSN